MTNGSWRISSGVPSAMTDPVGHHDDTLGDPQGDVHVVLDEQQRRPDAEGAEQLGELFALTTRQARGGLVEHHQLWIGDDDHADLELALLAVGEIADHGVEPIAEPHRRRGGPRRLPAGAA